MSETQNARWVRRQLERRGFPHLTPPIVLHQVGSEPYGPYAGTDVLWYATDRRQVEVAVSREPISTLKRGRVIGVWPGYGPMLLETE